MSEQLNPDPYLEKWMEFVGDPNSATMLLALASGQLRLDMIDSAPIPAHRKWQILRFYHASADEQNLIVDVAQAYIEEYGLLTDDGYSKADFPLQMPGA